MVSIGTGNLDLCLKKRSWSGRQDWLAADRQALKLPGQLEKCGALEQAERGSRVRAAGTE